MKRIAIEQIHLRRRNAKTMDQGNERKTINEHGDESVRSVMQGNDARYTAPLKRVAVEQSHRHRNAKTMDQEKVRETINEQTNKPMWL